MIKTVLLVVVAAIALLLIYATTRPDTFAVERSTTIAAPAGTLFPLINDMRQFNAWNPYARKDPAMKAEYSGAAAGPGAVFDFHGNKDVGRGRISITGASAPSSVTMQLDMWEPFEGHNTVNFTLVPDGAGTRVTWAMHGPSAFITKLMGIFFNMDQMIGRDFEAGLANLKQLAEKA
jgi:uncharacterized protein YndB with AHSA1/START domain